MAWPVQLVYFIYRARAVYNSFFFYLEEREERFSDFDKKSIGLQSQLDWKCTFRKYQNTTCSVIMSKLLLRVPSHSPVRPIPTVWGSAVSSRCCFVAGLFNPPSVIGVAPVTSGGPGTSVTSWEARQGHKRSRAEHNGGPHC